jgi:hypothetical protein
VETVTWHLCTPACYQLSFRLWSQFDAVCIRFPRLSSPPGLCSGGSRDHVHACLVGTRAPASDGVSNFFSTAAGVTVNYSGHRAYALLMLNCRACLWRCIQALDTTATSSQRLRLNGASSRLYGHQRYSTRSTNNSIRKAEARPNDLAEVDKVARAKQEPWRKSTQLAGAKKMERKSLAKQSSLGKDANDLASKRDPTMTATEFRQR